MIEVQRNDFGQTAIAEAGCQRESIEDRASRLILLRNQLGGWFNDYRDRALIARSICRFISAVFRVWRLSCTFLPLPTPTINLTSPRSLK